MISVRRIATAISCGLFVVAPLMCAQDVKPFEARLIIRPPTLVQELPLKTQRLLSFSLPAEPVAAPWVEAPDLSRYRGFQFGMDLLAVAKQAEMETSEAKVIHQRPALIQELEWRPAHFAGSSSQAEPVQEVLFSFYNGELFRMLVSYDRYRTEGLTDEDMVAAISAQYGKASKPDTKVVLFSSVLVYNDTEKVIARWEDSQYSINLFRSSYQPTFGILVFSKQLDPLAQTAIADAIRLDDQEAPQREIEREKKQAQEERAAEEKARLVNKATFRP